MPEIVDLTVLWKGQELLNWMGHVSEATVSGALIGYISIDIG